jgi:hypothetical protein
MPRAPAPAGNPMRSGACIRRTQVGRNRPLHVEKGSPKDLKGENHGLRMLARRHRHRGDAAALHVAAAAALLRGFCCETAAAASFSISHDGMSIVAAAVLFGVSVNVYAHQPHSKNSGCRCALAASRDHGVHRYISPGSALHARPGSEMAAKASCVDRPIEVGHLPSSDLLLSSDLAAGERGRVAIKKCRGAGAADRLEAIMPVHELPRSD